MQRSWFLALTIALATLATLFPVGIGVFMRSWRPIGAKPASSRCSPTRRCGAAKAVYDPGHQRHPGHGAAPRRALLPVESRRTPAYHLQLSLPPGRRRLWPRPAPVLSAAEAGAGAPCAAAARRWRTPDGYDFSSTSPTRSARRAGPSVGAAAATCRSIRRSLSMWWTATRACWPWCIPMPAASSPTTQGANLARLQRAYADHRLPTEAAPPWQVR